MLFSLTMRNKARKSDSVVDDEHVGPESGLKRSPSAPGSGAFRSRGSLLK